MGTSQSTQKAKYFEEKSKRFQASSANDEITFVKPKTVEKYDFPQYPLAGISANLAKRFLHSFFANKDLKICQLNSVLLESMLELTNTIKTALLNEKDPYFFAVKEESKNLFTVFVAKTSESIDALGIQNISMEFEFTNDTMKYGKYNLGNRLRGFFLCKYITDITFSKVDLCDFSDFEELLKEVNNDYKEVQIDTKSTPVSGKYINLRIWKKFSNVKVSQIQEPKTKNDADFIDTNKI